MHTRNVAWIAALGVALVMAAPTRAEQAASAESDVLVWDRLPDLPEPPGVGGPFCGVAAGSLVVAGGANFPAGPPWEGGVKRWHDAVWALDAPDGSWRRLEGRLPRPLAYGVAATWRDGVVCVGGSDADGHHAEAFFLRVDGSRLIVDPLPPLPLPLANAAGCLHGARLYVVGGITALEAVEAEAGVWVLDLEQPDAGWQALPPLPAPGRMLACVGVQGGMLVVAGGTALGVGQDGVATRQPTTTAFALQIDRAAADWRRLLDPPRPIIAAPAPAIAIGPAHLLFLGGDDGVRPAAGPAAHQGFPRDVLAYHTITDTWCRRGELPEAAVTTAVVPWQGRFVIPGGEIRPGVRTTAVWSCRPLERRPAIRWPDIVAVAAYLLAVLALGGVFSRQKDTDQFFLAAHKIPWWAAGISIYATMLSSITFMAIPAKAYATDWAYFLGSLTVVALVPVIIGVYLPFFRRVHADSAYEYLERRFNSACRGIASLSFILFQVGRMAIVTVLPALALATVANVDVFWCIAIVGLTSVAYTVVGGIEAVIWADVLQAIVLLGGAIAILLTVILQVPGGAGGIYGLAAADAKLFSGLSWSWDVALPTAWVILVGNLFSNLIPYTASQDVVQRYMTTSDAATAARAIRVNALVTVPSSALFFAVGTALYAFYSVFPERLDPMLPTDAILPMFVSRELPAGLAGLVVAGVFAAAQSTVAGSLTSVSTCWLADFEDQWFPGRDDAGRLGRARRTTAVFGVLGTVGALVVAGLGVTSLWDGFLELLGLTGGALAGLFALGILSRRATGGGAIVGAAASVASLAALKWGLPGRVHMLLYGAIGIVVCFAIGWLASLFIGRGPADLRGLTLFTLDPDAPARQHIPGEEA